MLDVDNTLIDFNLKILDGAKEWCQELKDQGIKLCILSNTNKIEKVKRVAKELDLQYINFAKKPSKKGFKEAMNLLEIDSKNLAAVGDQIMTDVLRGKQDGRNFMKVNVGGGGLFLDVIQFEEFMGSDINKYKEAFEDWYYEEAIEFGMPVRRQRSDLKYKYLSVNVVIDWMREVAPNCKAKVIEYYVQLGSEDQSLPYLCL